jgi:hypothetical protein
MQQWIMHGVGGATDVRVREEEFSAVDGLTASELARLFEETIAEVRTVINSLAPEKLTDRTTPQGRDVSKLEAIYQVERTWTSQCLDRGSHMPICK